MLKQCSCYPFDIIKANYSRWKQLLWAKQNILSFVLHYIVNTYVQILLFIHFNAICLSNFLYFNVIEHCETKRSKVGKYFKISRLEFLWQ